MATLQEWYDEIKAMTREERKNKLLAFNELLLNWPMFKREFSGHGLDFLHDSFIFSCRIDEEQRITEEQKEKQAVEAEAVKGSLRWSRGKR